MQSILAASPEAHAVNSPCQVHEALRSQPTPPHRGLMQGMAWKSRASLGFLSLECIWLIQTMIAWTLDISIARSQSEAMQL